VPEIEEVAAGSFLEREPPEIRGTGYVVRSLEAALWAFDRTDSFRDAVLAAANLGDDADTTAAICGQLAGAYYGASAIPPDWLGKLAMRERIEEMADELLDLSGIAADPEASAATEPSPPAQ
jgi:ADP-ribosyl-[dinitrogen reductase] hydrolase